MTGIPWRINPESHWRIRWGRLLLDLLIDGLRLARRTRRANGRVTFSVAAVIGRPDSRVLRV
jgi:hypothetical protein